MATPLRDAEPRPIHDRAIQDLSFIRRTMEGASSFTDVPGWGLAVIGVTALVAAGAASLQPSAGRWLAVWLAEALLGVSLSATFLWRKMRKRAITEERPVLSVPARKFFFGLWPAIIAGAVLTFALIDASQLWGNGTSIPRVLPGLWLLLYGVAVTTAGASSVRPVPMMGMGFMLLGAVALYTAPRYGDLLLAIGFGALHITFGVLIARRHGG